MVALGSAHLLPHICVSVALGRILIEGDNVHNSLWVGLLILFRDAGLLQQLLPLFRKTRELAGIRVEAHMCQVHRVVRCRDLDLLLLREHIAHRIHKATKDALERVPSTRRGCTIATPLTVSAAVYELALRGERRCVLAKGASFKRR